MDLASALAGLNAALETLKALRGLDKAFDQAVFRTQLVDLMEAVSDARIALLEAKGEVAARDAEIEALKSKLKRQAETVDFGGYTYAANADGKPTGAPFCSVCLINDGTQIRYDKAVANFWRCSRCEAIASDLTVFP